MVDATPERQEHGCLRPADVAQLATTALTLPRSEAELVDAMHALVQLDRVTGRRRERLAISAVLDHGWSYSRLAEVYGVTRQAAHKLYAPAAAAELHRRVRQSTRAAAAAGDITVTDQEVHQP
jgi:hypothetical protein